MVDATDEALVLQIVQYYFPRWKEEVVMAGLGLCMEEQDGEKDDNMIEEEDESSTSTGKPSSVARGAKRGKVKTLCKTTKDFFSWHQKVLKARASPYCEKWDEWLRTKALTLEAEKEIGLSQNVDDQSVADRPLQQNTMFDMMQSALNNCPVEVV